MKIEVSSEKRGGFVSTARKSTANNGIEIAKMMFVNLGCKMLKCENNEPSYPVMQQIPPEGNSRANIYWKFIRLQVVFQRETT